MPEQYDAHLTLVTLGVGNLERSIAFYETMGFRRKSKGAEGVGFFQAGACAIAVWSSAELAKDANFADEGMAPAFRGVALAWNCHTREEADAVMKRAARAGAKVQKPTEETFWGGYVGYFTDPDGHLWEIAHNPAWPLDDDGRAQIPD
jgi:catechol 2,3-dioxygenase-like lactoylglutathione lyase family enzyme